MDRTLKIFVSCAFGAGIGAFVALEFNQYFWWVGMLIGGLIGYLSYEFKEVVRAVPKAWHTAVNWKQSEENVIGTIMVFHIVAYFLQWTFLVAFLLHLVVPSMSFDAATWGLIAVLGFAFFMFNFSVVFPLMEQGSRFWNYVDNVCEKRIFLGPLLYFNLISIVVIHVPFMIWECCKQVWECCKQVWILLYAFGLFLKEIFILIHSEFRLLCGVDAAIGAAIGYFSGSALVGALAGGLFGVLNYEIVSKRILRVVPSR